MRLICLALLVSSCFADTSRKTERAIDDAGNEVTNDKFKIYVGTIDGIRREVFNEVDGGQLEVEPDNSPNPADPFGAYDDNNVISTDNEKNLFVPKPYRPDNEKKAKTTKKPRPTTTPPPPPTTIRTIPFIQTTPIPEEPRTLATVATQRPLPPQPIQTVAPVFRPPPTAPPRVPIQPFQPQPFVPAVQPTQPPVFNTPPPPQPFRPQPQPQQPFRPFQPQPQPQPQFTQRPFTQPPPVQTPPPTTPAPSPPFRGGNGLRSGQCPASVFYISTPISGPSRLTFTHFAVAVTVDQCARTCHEFNCAIAHYNPLNGHCEFNPSTAFAIRNGQCPAWPSLHYRNNVVANEPVRIFCVTCQRPRRRQGGGRQNQSPFQRRQFNPRGHRIQRTPAAVSFADAVSPQEKLPTRNVNVQETSAKTVPVEISESNDSRASQLSALRELEELQI